MRKEVPLSEIMKELDISPQEMNEVIRLAKLSYASVSLEEDMSITEDEAVKAAIVRYIRKKQKDGK